MSKRDYRSKFFKLDAVAARAVDQKAFTQRLEQDGWNTPDTYCNHWDEAGHFSAVYLFLIVDQHNHSKQALPAYVGMSVNLAQRWSGHEVLRELADHECWVMRWFKRTPEEHLRRVERLLIQQFNPAWNLVHRPRGVV